MLEITYRDNRREYRDIALGLIILYVAAFSLMRMFDSFFSKSNRENTLFVIVVLLTICLIIFLDYKVNYEVSTHFLFADQGVSWKSNHKKIALLYQDILTVEEIMIISRTQTKPGSYRIKIRTKYRSYALYSTAKEIQESVSFEQTDLSKLYLELKKHGVKCC